MWPFTKLKLSEIWNSILQIHSLVTFQVLNNHMWLVVTILDNTDYRTFLSLQKIIFLIFLVFIYLCERESMGGTERNGGTESKVGSRFWAVSTKPDAGLELMNREIITQAKVRVLTESPRCPSMQKILLDSSGLDINI